MKCFIGKPNNEETIGAFKSAVQDIISEFAKPLSITLVNNVMDKYEEMIKSEINDYFGYGIENKVSG